MSLTNHHDFFSPWITLHSYLYLVVATLSEYGRSPPQLMLKFKHLSLWWLRNHRLKRGGSCCAASAHVPSSFCFPTGLKHSTAPAKCRPQALWPPSLQSAYSSPFRFRDSAGTKQKDCNSHNMLFDLHTAGCDLLKCSLECPWISLHCSFLWFLVLRSCGLREAPLLP